MAICRHYQVPHSHFMGGPLKWTDLDRDKAVAYEWLLREQCPRCGTLPEDWVDERNRPLDEPVWAAVARHCHGCDEMERLQEKVPKRIKGTYVAFIPFAHLTDDDDDWYDPTRDPVEIERRREQELEAARSLAR